MAEEYCIHDKKGHMNNRLLLFIDFSEDERMTHLCITEGGRAYTRRDFTIPFSYEIPAWKSPELPHQRKVLQNEGCLWECLQLLPVRLVLDSWLFIGMKLLLCHHNVANSGLHFWCFQEKMTLVFHEAIWQAWQSMDNPPSDTPFLFIDSSVSSWREGERIQLRFS